MNKDKQTFDLQDAPEKNTDAAFVQVGTDGKPIMPESDSNEQNANENSPQEGTLADR